jgi:superfamily II DNA or RNA helicase
MATISPALDAAIQAEETEAYRALVDRVGKRSARIPAGVLARHVMQCVPAEEWPTRVEAMDALLRRLEAIKRDELRIDTRPGDGRRLGAYTTRRRGSGARPYETIVSAIDPIEAGCNCPDFVKNSLGVCKHVLIVLEHLYAKPRLLQRARKEQEFGPPVVTSCLHWNPIRPLTGLGDWLERVGCDLAAEKDAGRAVRTSPARRWFRPGGNGSLVLENAYNDNLPRRLELVEDLVNLFSRQRARSHDPALRSLLLGERDRLRSILKRRLTPDELRGAYASLKRPLYPYQRGGVERFLEIGRLLLADDMGLGKTAQAIAVTDILVRTRRIRRGLIIAPASLKPQWAREWDQFSHLPISVIDGTPAERLAVYQAHRSGLFIINYEQLIRDLETIRRWAPDLVVLDEAQRIKNWATKTALSVKGLSPLYRLVLTGTPMENRIDELASIVEWVDDMALEPKWRLTALHAIRSDGRREVTGVRHLDTLRDRLRGCMVRRIRQDVLDQLPPRTDTRVPVDLTDEQQEEHDALIQPIIRLMELSKKRPLTQTEFLRLMSFLTAQRIISNGLAQLRFEDIWPSIRTCAPEESVIKGLSSPKLLELRQLVRQIVLDQGRKVVIFSQWRRMLTLAHWAVSDLLSGDGLRAGFFTGAEGQKRRTQNIVEFHDDDRFRILFASDAGGVGLNLQHAANCVINLELPWNPAVLEQRIGRVYRLGQKNPIDVFNLVCEEGIESRILNLVGSKQAFFKGLFDGDNDSVQFDQSSSFLSRIQQIYDPAKLAIAPTPLDSDQGPLGETGDIDLDDEVSDPFEPLLDAADESEDQPASPTPTPAPAPAPVAPLPERRQAALQPAPAASVPADSQATHPGPLPGLSDVRTLFSQLQVRRDDTGKVVIEAPPEAASTLGALFEGMAALLQAVSRPPE